MAGSTGRRAPLPPASPRAEAAPSRRGGRVGLLVLVAAGVRGWWFSSTPARGRTFDRNGTTASDALLGPRAAEAAKAAFVASRGTPSAELWLNQGYVFARTHGQSVLVEGFRAIDPGLRPG